MSGTRRKRWLGIALAATIALSVGAPVGSGAANPCPGNYALREAASGDRSLDVDLNGNGFVCAYQGSKADVPPFKDDRVK